MKQSISDHFRTIMEKEMRKLQKVAVVAVALGSVGFFGAGTSYASGGGSHFGQGSQCRTHDLNVDVLGEVGILNGVLGSALNGEGSPGAQSSPIGSSIGCNNSIGK